MVIILKQLNQFETIVLKKILLQKLLKFSFKTGFKNREEFFNFFFN